MYLESLIKQGCTKDPIFLATLTTWGYQFHLPSLNHYSPQYFITYHELLFPLPSKKPLCKLLPQAGFSHSLQKQGLSSRLILLVDVSPVSPCASAQIVHDSLNQRRRGFRATLWGSVVSSQLSLFSLGREGFDISSSLSIWQHWVLSTSYQYCLRCCYPFSCSDRLHLCTTDPAVYTGFTLLSWQTDWDPL